LRVFALCVLRLHLRARRLTRKRSYGARPRQFLAPQALPPAPTTSLLQQARAHLLSRSFPARMPPADAAAPRWTATSWAATCSARRRAAAAAAATQKTRPFWTW
jgi:hypothetical protein